ncbi:MAG: NUDIX domain-containing protein [Parcubacteria group bacterium]|nr:NUDIX domain-containing protein [Parcubacteria group bacterium]
MENKDNYLHEIAITAIIVKEEKYLITRRAKTKKKFPGRWTVPGGRLEVSDYQNLPKDTEYHWYNIVGKTLRREVREEVGLEIENVDYLTSITMLVGDHPTLILSYMADYKSGEIMLQKEELDEYKWVTLEEAKQYDLIEGIYDELVMAENKRKGIKTDMWSRAT